MHTHVSNGTALVSLRVMLAMPCMIPVGTMKGSCVPRVVAEMSLHTGSPNVTLTFGQGCAYEQPRPAILAGLLQPQQHLQPVLALPADCYDCIDRSILVGGRANLCPVCKILLGPNPWEHGKLKYDFMLDSLVRKVCQMRCSSTVSHGSSTLWWWSKVLMVGAYASTPLRWDLGPLWP